MRLVLPRFALSIRLFISLLLFGSAGPVLIGQTEADTYNTTFFDGLDPRPPVPPVERYSALWGYTAPNGREYALLGGYTGTHIIDITEKPIVEVAFIPGPHSQWREMKTAGQYAYVVNETGEGLQIIDLSDLPNSATLITSDSSVFRTGHTITQEGDFLYVSGTNVEAGANQGVMIFSLADDPLAPKLVGQYAERYVHDVAVRNDTMYAAAIDDGKLDIVYLGPDRTDPKFVVDIPYVGGGTHNSALTEDGRYVMTTDEVGTTQKSLKVWDIADRENIAKVADWTPAPFEIIHNVHISGNLAFISWYTAGTRIADISDPANPVEIAHFDADFSGQAFAFAGNWEVYANFASGKVIASYMENGLYVFTLDVHRKGSVRGRVRDAVSGDPLPGAVIRVPGLNKVVRADNEGKYEIAAGEGSLDYTVSAVNYLLGEGSLTLTNNGTDHDILVTPLTLRTITLVPKDSKENTPLTSPVAYNILTRREEKRQGGEPISLILPNDSAYTVIVGAWGYIPVEISLPVGANGEIAVPLEKGYADNAEIDLGWSLDVEADDAIAGKWGRYSPQPGSFIQLPDGNTILLAPEADRTPGSGTNVFGTVTPSFDVDSGSTTLTSPQFDLSTYENPILSFDLWYSNDVFFWLPADDNMQIMASNDGGDHWTLLERITTSTDGWKRKSYALNDFLPLTDRMLFRAVASDLNEQVWVFAAIDEFSVVEGTPSGVETPSSRDTLHPSTLALFPNPMTDNGMLEVYLSGKQSAVWIDLLDGLGRRIGTVYQGELNEGKTLLPVKSENLSPGFYILRFVGDDGSARYLPATVE